MEWVEKETWKPEICFYWEKNIVELYGMDKVWMDIVYGMDKA